jgi:hypothetical protein
MDFYPKARLDMIRGAYSSREDDFDAAFSKTPQTTIENEPLEETQFYQHVIECGWTEERLQRYNVLPERHLKARLVEEARKNLKEYDGRAKELTRRGKSEFEIQQIIGVRPPELRKYDPLSMKEERIAPAAAPPASRKPKEQPLKRYKTWLGKIDAPLVNPEEDEEEKILEEAKQWEVDEFDRTMAAATRKRPRERSPRASPLGIAD